MKLSIAAAAFSWAAVTWAQDSPQFRADVALVRVDAEVTDGTRTLTGLAKSDFLVFDNGKPQEVLYFSEGEEPLDIILLFDVSGSMSNAVRKIAASARAALSELRQGDRVAVMSFTTTTRIVTELTDDFDAVERDILDKVLARIRGGTLIMTAVDDAGGYFLRMPRAGRRRAVLIITDNVGMRSRREEPVVRRYWEADAVLSGVILRSKVQNTMIWTSRISSPQSMLFQQGMKGVAEKTGGDVLQGSDPVETFREMMHRVRQRYSLYYRMPQVQPGEVRNVRLELTVDAKKRLPAARVRARKGYVAEKTPGVPLVSK